MDAFEMALLFDYYGGMLTEKQREYLNMRYNQDMSLSEIASVFDVSRQAVFDNLNRAEAHLRRMEEVVGCIRRDRTVAKAAQTITQAAKLLAQSPDGEVAALAGTIISAAQALEE